MFGRSRSSAVGQSRDSLLSGSSSAMGKSTKNVYSNVGAPKAGSTSDGSFTNGSQSGKPGVGPTGAALSDMKNAKDAASRDFATVTVGRLESVLRELWGPGYVSRSRSLGGAPLGHCFALPPSARSTRSTHSAHAPG